MRRISDELSILDDKISRDQVPKESAATNVVRAIADLAEAQITACEAAAYDSVKEANARLDLLLIPADISDDEKSDLRRRLEDLGERATAIVEKV